MREKFLPHGAAFAGGIGTCSDVAPVIRNADAVGVDGHTQLLQRPVVRQKRCILRENHRRCPCFGDIILLQLLCQLRCLILIFLQVGFHRTDVDIDLRDRLIFADNANGIARCRCQNQNRDQHAEQHPAITLKKTFSHFVPSKPPYFAAKSFIMRKPSSTYSPVAFAVASLNVSGPFFGFRLS